MPLFLKKGQLGFGIGEKKDMSKSGAFLIPKFDNSRPPKVSTLVRWNNAIFSQKESIRIWVNKKKSCLKKRIFTTQFRITSIKASESPETAIRWNISVHQLK